MQQLHTPMVLPGSISERLEIMRIVIEATALVLSGRLDELERSESDGED